MSKQRRLDSKKFTLIEDGLAHTTAINTAAAYRRGQGQIIRSGGQSGYKRHLYRIGRVGKLWGVFEYRRNPRQY